MVEQDAVEHDRGRLLFLDALSFVVSYALLAAFLKRRPGALEATQSVQVLLADLAEGARFLVRDRNRMALVLLGWGMAASLIAPEAVADFFKNLAARGYVGCNVTLPHKEAALAASKPDDRARAVGAANTLWLDGGELYSTNTDVEGFTANLDAAVPGWDGGAREAVEDMRVGSIRRPAVVLGDRVLKLRRKLGSQLLLEARKTGKADLLGQAQDARCRHRRLAGEDLKKGSPALRAGPAPEQLDLRIFPPGSSSAPVAPSAKILVLMRLLVTRDPADLASAERARRTLRCVPER